MKPFQYYAIVREVIDGDSVWVDIDLGFHHWIKKRNIRLKNLDTPEHRTSDKYEEKFGEYSWAKLKELLPVGSKIMLETDFADHDKFGRILGTIINANEVQVNNFMLEKRYAVPYEGQNKAEIRAAHEANWKYLVENGEVKP